jgi:hypothetical protein
LKREAPKSMKISSSNSLLGQTLNHEILESKIESEDDYPTVEEWLAMPDPEKL